jgi:hypothetical protein
MMDSADRAQRYVCLRVRSRSTACGVYAVDSATIVNTEGRSGVLTPICAGEMDSKEHTVVGTVAQSSRSFECAGRCGGSPNVRKARSHESDAKGGEAGHLGRR